VSDGCGVFSVKRAFILLLRAVDRIVQKLGHSTLKFKEFKIQNMVGTCDVRFAIRLEGLADEHGEFCSVRAPSLAILC